MDFYKDYQDKLRLSNSTLGIDKEPIETEPGWYLIPGFSRYRISKDYQLLDKFNGDIIKPSMRMNDYPVVTIAYDENRMKKKSCDFHRLVALAFIPVPEKEFGERIEVDHVDGTRTNYKVENLEWVTKTVNYKRGRITARARTNGTIYRVINKVTGGDMLVKSIEDACHMVGVDKPTALESIELCGRYFGTPGWLIIEIDIEKCSGYRNPIYVCDYVDGSGFICKSFTDAMDLTSVSKSGIETSLKSSLLPECGYVKGYKFFRVGAVPDKIEKVTMGEALFWTYIRRYHQYTTINTNGYLVYNPETNKVYPAISLDDIAYRMNVSYDAKVMAECSKTSSAFRGHIIVPIYKRTKSGRVLPNVTEQYHIFMKTFDGEYILKNGNFKDS